MEQTKGVIPIWPIWVYYLILNVIPDLILFASDWSAIDEMTISGFIAGALFGVSSAILFITLKFGVDRNRKLVDK